jgi:hypothetical protein
MLCIFDTYLALYDVTCNYGNDNLSKVLQPFSIFNRIKKDQLL